MISASEERFRLLFHALDVENEWKKHLTDVQLRYTRVAAESAETWLPFLTGIPPEKKEQNMEVDLSEEALKQDEIQTISAIVRKRLTFAAIDEDFFTNPSDGHEDDQGLMSGDDGGYTNYEELVREEDSLERERTGVYSLLGCHEDDLTRMPFPSFGGRVREVLQEGLKLCHGEPIEVLKRIVETEERDGYASMEECLKAVESFLSTHRESLGDTYTKIESRITNLRSEHEKLDSWFTTRKTSNEKLANMLGAKLPLLQSSNEPSRRPPCDESTLCYKATGKASTTSRPKRPRVPVFRSLPPTKADTRSLWEILGPRNAIVTNLSLYERVMKLKKEMYKLQGMTPPTRTEPVLPKRVKPILEIQESDEEREKKLTEAGVALILSHAGFTYADSAALDLLTGVFERYVRDTGRALISTRENIDNNAASVAERMGRRRVKSREEVIAELEVVLERVKGGFPELQNYVRADVMRTEQALKEVEARMRIRIRELTNAKSEPKEVKVEEKSGENGAEPVSEEDIVLGDGLAFGYLGKQVWVDLLDGIRVPRKFVKADEVKEEAMVVDS